MKSAIMLIAMTALLNGCAMFTTSKNSKYGTSTQGVPIKNLDMSKIKAGMHKKQVADVIGHPPHINPFSPDTWTYSHIRHGQTVNGEQIVLSFENNKLKKISRQKDKQTSKSIFGSRTTQSAITSA